MPLGKAKITRVELARRLGHDVVEARRVLNLRYGTKLDQLEKAESPRGWPGSQIPNHLMRWVLLG
jgi:hypothetical protein